MHYYCNTSVFATNQTYVQPSSWRVMVNKRDYTLSCSIFKKNGREVQLIAGQIVSEPGLGLSFRQVS